jgi:hypothetical protein
MTHAYQTALGKPNERDHLGDLGVDGETILKQISKKQSVRAVTGFICQNRKIILI